MDDNSNILSVGIDIGTSTTQVIFSRLFFKNSSSYFAVPHISISNKEVVYKGEIIRTPLLSPVMIDGAKVRDIVDMEFKKAGYLPSDTQTGAVIITGESARKVNSETVLAELSDFAGEFVVSTAGPDLEAIIAGKGSGAQEYSRQHHCRIVNLDIGGGTTNAVVFDCGEVVAKGCLDIGGRQVTYQNGVINYISPSAKKIAVAAQVSIAEGDPVREAVLMELSCYMAELLYLWVLGKQNKLLHEITTQGSSAFVPGRIDGVCFSGGVGFCVYDSGELEWMNYCDLGILLGRAIGDSCFYKEQSVIPARETLRATVIGAGSYTTSVSGSTITYSRDIFPLKNVPVLRLTRQEEAQCQMGGSQWLASKLEWMLKQTDSDLLVLSMAGPQNPSYLELKGLAECLVTAMEQVLKQKTPMLVIVEQDIAKALGQYMRVMCKDSARDIVCIDSIQAIQNDFVDFGHPVAGGIVIPVVVKTLIFG